MKFLSIILLLMGLGQFSSAAEVAHDAESQYFEITDIEHVLIEEQAWEPVELYFGLDLYQPSSVTSEVSLTDLINFGEKIWEIIKENEPVLDFKTKSAMAIPASAKEPFNLENWSLPVANTYQLIFKNGFGSKVVVFTYKVIFSSQGSYEGAGRYLANVSVHPVEISVSWGYTFNALVEIGDILNLSSKEDPHAGMQVNVVWDVETVIKKIKGGDYYFVQGDGGLTRL